MAGDKLDNSSESAALWAIAEGVEAESGDRFFYSLVRNLATTLQCQYSFVSELSADRKSFKTLAVWGRGIFLENFETPLAGTPCEAVLGAAHPIIPNVCANCSRRTRGWLRGRLRAIRECLWLTSAAQ